MKKLIAVMLALVMTVCLFAGCGAQTADSGSVKVVTTIFPLYDWVREVSAGADIELSMLLDNGVDLHSYQPTAKDIMDISDCDLFVYVGGESDEWVSDVLNGAENDDMIVLDLLDILGGSAKAEELVDGMQGELEDEEIEFDEHVWLSLKNAKLFVSEIADALNDIDHANAELYASNARDYIATLSALDSEYREAADNAEKHTLLFGDRFPFRYMTDDYGMSYYAAFSGCSAETEASFETITFLSDKVNELGLSAIMKIETSDGSVAETVRNNTELKDQEILTLDSMQNVTADRISAGETYLSIMEANLEILKQALK